MKIGHIFRFLKSSTLNEGISLSDLRKKLAKGELSFSEKEIWPKEMKEDKEEVKDSLLDIMGRIVGANADKMLNNQLKNFDTDRYYEKGTIKPISLRNALLRKIVSVEAKNQFSKTKNNLSDQYEKINLNNGVELYAVYTPQANVYLAHNLLKSKVVPSWCIASPSSSLRFWNHYHLFDAPYPCVFIVAKKNKKGEYEKYQLKGNPVYCNSFLDETGGWESKLWGFINEWRDAKQKESNFDNTSLFKKLDITSEELEDGIKKLMKSDKAKTFSEKYGEKKSSQYNLQSGNGIESEERLKNIVGLCQLGKISLYRKYLDSNEVDFAIEKLIEYNNLFEYDIESLSTMRYFSPSLMRTALKSLIKNNRCTEISVKYSLDLRYHCEDLIDDIIDSIEPDVMGFGLLMTLENRTSDMNHEPYYRCIDRMYETNAFDKDSIGYICRRKGKKPEKIEEIINKLIDDGKAKPYFVTLDVSDKTMKRILDFNIKNSKFDNSTLRKSFYAKIAEDEILSILKNMYKNDKIDDKTSEIVAKLGTDSQLKYVINVLSKKELIDINLLKSLLINKKTQFISFVVKKLMEKLGSSLIVVLRHLVNFGQKDLAKKVANKIAKNGDISFEYMTLCQSLYSDEKIIKLFYNMVFSQSNKNDAREIIKILSRYKIYDEKILNEVMTLLDNKGLIFFYFIREKYPFMDKFVNFLISNNIIDDSFFSYYFSSVFDYKIPSDVCKRTFGKDYYVDIIDYLIKYKKLTIGNLYQIIEHFLGHYADYNSVKEHPVVYKAIVYMLDEYGEQGIFEQLKKSNLYISRTIEKAIKEVSMNEYE